MSTTWDTTWDEGQTVWDASRDSSAGGCYELLPRCGIEEYEEYACEDVVCRRPQPPLNPVTCAVPCRMVPCLMIPCNADCGTVTPGGSSTPCLFVPCEATPCT
jgi:hypothetical protein